MHTHLHSVYHHVTSGSQEEDGYVRDGVDVGSLMPGDGYPLRTVPRVWRQPKHTMLSKELGNLGRYMVASAGGQRCCVNVARRRGATRVSRSKFVHISMCETHAKQDHASTPRPRPARAAVAVMD